jgi:hypothetical protein
MDDSIKSGFDFLFLNNCWYVIPSNDEKDSQKYYPTSLQDVEPENLA